MNKDNTTVTGISNLRNLLNNRSVLTCVGLSFWNAHVYTKSKMFSSDQSYSLTFIFRSRSTAVALHALVYITMKCFTWIPDRHPTRHHCIWKLATIIFRWRLQIPTINKTTIKLYSILASQNEHPHVSLFTEMNNGDTLMMNLSTKHSINRHKTENN